MQLQALLVSSALLTGSALVEAWSPSNGYAPSLVTCDDNINLIREADTLSQNETDWLTKRNVYTQEALQSFLDRATSNFSDNSLLSSLFTSGNGSTVPKIGVACSGGGYRAMLSGAGMLAAMDNRTDGANDHGLGGLLQSTTYLAGLSGGSWLVGSLAWNNWTSVQDILNNMSQNDSIWDITNSLASPGGTNSTASTERWADIVQAVASKEEAGFSITLADYWGRALAYNFFPSLPDGGVGYTWSSLRDADVFKNGEMPFPISVADFRHPNTVITNTNSTIFEFNPFEIGSWDDSLNAFSDVKYLGTEVSNGVPTTQGQCVEGFDNTGFIVGTSSTLFSPAMQPVIGLLLNNASVATIFEKAIGNDSNDVANYAPNPFKNANFATEKSETTVLDSDYLYLADGGEDSEGIPFTSLIQKDRDLDVIFALDNSADTSASWPAGLSLISTYERQFSAQGKGIAFPYVPDEATFLQLGLNNKPTFFGCDANNLTDLQYIPPLVVYIPNARHSFNSNQSTLKLSYTEPERFSMIQNGFEATTRGNFTEDPEFLGCVACAIIRRKQQSLNATLPEECESCFTNYCWNGTFSDSVSIVSNSSSSASSSSTNIASSSTSTLSPTSILSGTSSTTTSTLTSSISVENGAATIYRAIYNPRYIINILCMIAIFSILV